MRTAEVVFFGGVSLMRMTCDSCKNPAFVIAGQMACCSTRPPIPDKITLVREGTPDGSPKRHRPWRISKIQRDAMLREQAYCCAYCQQPFGARIEDLRTGRSVLLEVQWDHVVPWAYARSHAVSYVAACQICNRIKSASLYVNIEAARADIMEQRAARYKP